MFRLKAGAVIGGVFLIIFGVGDMWMNLRASSTPVELSLADLERGNGTKEINVKIGPHVAMYDYGVYLSNSKSGAAKFYVYPIVSDATQYQEQVGHDLTGLTGLTPGPARPSLGSVAVLVKTYTDPGFGFESRDSMQGMVLNNMSKLDDDMKEVLRKGYPEINVDRVIFIEKDRRPTVIRALLMMVGGVALIGVGAAMFMFLKTED